MSIFNINMAFLIVKELLLRKYIEVQIFLELPIFIKSYIKNTHK